MITYRVIRSARKTLQVEIRPDGEVLVRAPQRLADAEIRRFVESKAGWIAEHRAKVKARAEQAADVERLSMEDIRRLADEAAKDIPERVSRFAPVVGVQYGRITIRNQKSKWGSCSSQGNLNFNCLLMLAPPSVRDYVVVHELCHLIELNHSKRFWTLVAAVLPEYRKEEQWLKTQGMLIMRKMTG
ncbi:MAG: M48 family metallopeptidase [Lachnospiraceae bacterium]|nr:M48 family metallopeptidase [Lachnospiraceae bacterium]